MCFGAWRAATHRGTETMQPMNSGMGVGECEWVHVSVAVRMDVKSEEGAMHIGVGL